MSQPGAVRRARYRCESGEGAGCVAAQSACASELEPEIDELVLGRTLREDVANPKGGKAVATKGTLIDGKLAAKIANVEDLKFVNIVPFVTDEVTFLPADEEERFSIAQANVHLNADNTFADNRISVRFEYESRDPDGQWWRSHGNEHWEFDEQGYMRRRDASINDYRIEESERRVHPG